MCWDLPRFSTRIICELMAPVYDESYDPSPVFAVSSATSPPSLLTPRGQKSTHTSSPIDWVHTFRIMSTHIFREAGNDLRHFRRHVIAKSSWIERTKIGPPRRSTSYNIIRNTFLFSFFLCWVPCTLYHNLRKQESRIINSVDGGLGWRRLQFKSSMWEWSAVWGRGQDDIKTSVLMQNCSSFAFRISYPSCRNRMINDNNKDWDISISIKITVWTHQDDDDNCTFLY